jgi:hypothetical protein
MLGGKLRSDNRRVNLAQQIPREDIEGLYASSLSGTGQGVPVRSVRIAPGALIIKERLRMSDEKTLEQINSKLIRTGSVTFLNRFMRITHIELERTSVTAKNIRFGFQAPDGVDHRNKQKKTGTTSKPLKNWPIRIKSTESPLKGSSVRGNDVTVLAGS